LIIKPILEIQDIKQVGQVEAETWGMKLVDVVPDHVLTAVARDGGVLLGAYEDEHLIGFTLGWLGTVDPDRQEPAADQLKLVSHMTGVLPEFRDRRVGFQLKLAQRIWALERGLDLVTWTYDPLESRNAYFNIHLLGCVCRTYLRDYYGELSDDLNLGQVPSDRFRVNWWINDPRVKEILSSNQGQSPSERTAEDLLREGVSLLNPARNDKKSFIYPTAGVTYTEDTGVLVEIPSDMQAIRQGDQDLALCWRIHTREIFESLFEDDYQVIDFLFQRSPYPRSFYLLEKTDEN
jgi:predicted GNAT superfamily acetyltransferase